MLMVIGFGIIIGIGVDDCQEPFQNNMEEEEGIQFCEDFHLNVRSPVTDNEVDNLYTDETEHDNAEEGSLRFSNEQKIKRWRTIESEEDDIQVSESSLGSPSDNELSGKSSTICVGQLQHQGDNNRKYDKQVACFFCDKLLYGKMKRHLEKMHSNEPEVAKLMALSSKESRRGFIQLANRGNFKHNASVLNAGEGSLIVRRRPSKQMHNSDDYLPCEHCLGLFLKRDLWRHVAKCPVKPSAISTLSKNTKSRSSVISVSRMVLEGATHSDQVIVSEQFREDILDRMRFDTLTRRARNDILIMRYGSSLHHRHGRQRVHDVSQQMRQLARLLIEVRFEGDAAEQHVTLDRCLNGSHFDNVLEATERLCKREIDSDSGRPLFKNPSLGLKIGHILVKCADIKKGMAIRVGDKVMEAEADAFLTLHRSEWTNKISSASLASLKQRRYNNPDILPLTSDLVKLKEYQETSLTAFAEKLKKEPTYSVWRQLSDVVYSRVVIFNKRRGGETSRLHLNAFLKRPNWQEVANDVLVKSLKPLEQKLLKR